MPYRYAARLAALAFLLAATFAAPAQEAERLRIHGSATLGERVMPAIVRAWLRDSGYARLTERDAARGVHEISAERDGERVVIEIACNGTAQGFADLVEQNAELAMAAREPTAAEREAAWQLGDLDAPDQAFTVALGGVQFVVDARSPVRALSVAQLRDVYTGRTTRWSALGGADRPIRAVWTGPRTASGELLISAVTGGRPVVATRMAAGAVAHDPDLLRALPLGARVPPGFRALAISHGGTAVRPDRVGVMSEDYPLVRRHTLYGAPLMSALGRSLAMYAVGYRGQRAVESEGALSVMLRPVRKNTDADVLPVDTGLPGAIRLPLSLRFHVQGIDSPFDSRTVRDLDRLQALLQAPALRGRSLVVVAYADRQRGGRLIAAQLANDRADLVSTLLLQRGLRVISARGAGDARPLAGGGDARWRNERVELWLI